MYHLRVPETEQELQQYYQFRWEMLRKLLHQPPGSERDAYDGMAHHQMVVDEQGQPVAVGRLYVNADNEASIGAASCSRPGISIFRSARKWACASASIPGRSL